MSVCSKQCGAFVVTMITRPRNDWKCSWDNPVSIYLFKVSNRNTRTMCKICSKLTIKTPEQCHQYRSGVFDVNFEQTSHIVLVILLLT